MEAIRSLAGMPTVLPLTSHEAALYIQPGEGAEDRKEELWSSLGLPQPYRSLFWSILGQREERWLHAEMEGDTGKNTEQ